MTQSSGHLTKLVSLAREKSSDKRRELLRDIAGLFFDPEQPLEGEAAGTADEIMTRMIGDVEESVRLELSAKFADMDHAPAGLVNELARDVAQIALPLLERSGAVSDETLVAIAKTEGQAHLRAIAGRRRLSSVVSDAVVTRADDETLVTLTRNEGAELSRAALETIADAAERVEALRAPLIERADAPVDLLNELFPLVEERLREKISQRNEELDPAALAEVMEAARARLAKKSGGAPSDLSDAERFIDMKRLRKQVNAALVIDLFEQRQTTRAYLAFASLTELDYYAAKRVLTNPAIDPLAIACRAADMDVESFVKLAMFRPTASARDTANAQALQEIYGLLPLEAATRAMRFWRVRSRAADAA